MQILDFCFFNIYEYPPPGEHTSCLCFLFWLCFLPLSAGSHPLGCFLPLDLLGAVRAIQRRAYIPVAIFGLTAGACGRGCVYNRAVICALLRPYQLISSHFCLKSPLSSQFLIKYHLMYGVLFCSRCCAFPKCNAYTHPPSMKCPWVIWRRVLGLLIPKCGFANGGAYPAPLLP